MNKVELDQIIKDMNEGLEEDEEEIFLLNLRTYSKDEINYVVIWMIILVNRLEHHKLIQ